MYVKLVYNVKHTKDVTLKTSNATVDVARRCKWLQGGCGYKCKGLAGNLVMVR